MLRMPHGTTRNLKPPGRRTDPLSLPSTELDGIFIDSTVKKGRAFLVANSKAGDGESPPEIFDEFETLELDDLAATVFESPDRIVIAVWGGDGTCRTVAQHIVNTDVALLPAPGGTFSHFAKQAGFANVADVESGVGGVPTHERLIPRWLTRKCF